ncbi:AAA family ATPase [Micromonospora sp. NPDC004551]|uniref:ATP-dependent nuclease n=1 Tax=Micromonospora sp. NPDC004551 TaxID=3154284 RepID=UPI0033B9A58F
MQIDDSQSGPTWASELGIGPGDPSKVRVWVRSVQLFNQPSWDLPAPGVTAIVGGNNSGKSTFLRQLHNQLLSPGSETLDPVEIVSGITPARAGTGPDFLSWFAPLATYFPASYDVPEPSFRQPNTNWFMSVRGLLNEWEGGIRISHLGPAAQSLVFYADAMSRFGSVGGVGQRENPADPPTHPLHHFQDDVTLLHKLNALSERIFQQSLTLDEFSATMRLRVGKVDIPAPARDQSQRPYREALAKLPLLEQQGDGMKSLLGLVIPIIAAAHSTVIVDEPEAFLHPPQAYALGLALGELARDSNAQVILATHDRNLLGGLVASNAPLSVIRLNREGNTASASQLSHDQLRELWDDPVLQYSNVLDGLFHRIVVLAEAERDCRFYQAALDAYAEMNAGDQACRYPVPPPSDVLFVPSYGKAGMFRLAEVLRAAAVPVIATPDLDILNERSKIEQLVKSLGGEWSPLDKDYTVAAQPFRQPTESVLLAQIRKELLRAIDEKLKEDPGALHNADIKKELGGIIRAKESRWNLLKEFGVQAFNKGASGPASKRLLATLSKVGVVPVEVGELERFAGSDLEVAKGKDWLPAALEADIHKQRPAQSHIAKILNSARELAGLPE